MFEFNWFMFLPNLWSCFWFIEIVVFLNDFLYVQLVFCLSFFFKKKIRIAEYVLNPCVQIKDGFAEGKDLVVSVMSAMGEEQICALKDIGPK